MRFEVLLDKRNILIISAIFIALNFIRLFGNSLWWDECYAIDVAQHSWGGVIDMAAADVHPPLYDLTLKAVCTVLGYNFFTYQFTSFIAYLLLIATSLTIIRKWFGNMVAIIMVLCLNITARCFLYVNDVRMYEWAALFILWSVLATYLFLKENSYKNAVILSACSLLAAYTHLYCLLGLGFIYLCLIIISIIEKWKDYKPLILSIIICIVGYLPWIGTVLSSFQRASGDFWITHIVNPLEICGFIFGHQVMVGPFIVLAYVLFIVLSYEFRSASPYSDKVNFTKEAGKKSVEGKLAMIVLVAFIGTYLVALAISLLTRPLLLLRYLYPINMSLILVFAISLTRMRNPKALFSKFVVILIAFALPVTGYYVAVEAHEVYLTTEVLNATTDIENPDQILIYSERLDELIVQTYYDVEDVHVFDNFDSLPVSLGVQVWLFLEHKITDEQVASLSSQGYGYDVVYLNGALSDYSVNVYKLV